MSENQDHYCIAIGPDELSSGQLQTFRSSRAAMPLGLKWRTAEIITIRFLEGDPKLERMVREVAETWVASDMANLSFDWRTSGPTSIRIAFQPGKGSWSYIGTMCKRFPQIQPTMNFGWLTPDSKPEELQRVVLHEFGHAIGLIHEHQNPKGGIKWNRPAVVQSLSGPPNKWTTQQIETNMFAHYNDLAGTDFDSKSIMIYPIPASWTLDGFYSDFNRTLSESDRLLVRQQYPR